MLQNLIKIADKTRTLDRLHATEAPGYDLDKELKRVCQDVFKATLYDISIKDLLYLCQNATSFSDKGGATKLATKHGYSITSSGMILPDWQSFTVMILAKAGGYIREMSIEERFQQEANKFQSINAKAENRKEGTIKKYFADKNKRFGFIKPSNSGQDIFFHIAQCKGWEPQENLSVSYIIGEDKDGKPNACNVQKINPLSRMLRRDIIEFCYGMKDNTWLTSMLGYSNAGLTYAE